MPVDQSPKKIQKCDIYHFYSFKRYFFSFTGYFHIFCYPFQSRIEWHYNRCLKAIYVEDRLSVLLAFHQELQVQGQMKHFQNNKSWGTTFPVVTRSVFAHVTPALIPLLEFFCSNGLCSSIWQHWSGDVSLSGAHSESHKTTTTTTKNIRMRNCNICLHYSFRLIWEPGHDTTVCSDEDQRAEAK